MGMEATIEAGDRFLFGMSSIRMIVTVVKAEPDLVSASSESGAVATYPRWIFEKMVVRKL